MNTTTPEGAKKPPAAAGKFRRQLSSRLQMHAPSSIQVRAPPADVSEWNVAIPLLSPLDIVAIPRISDEAAPSQAEESRAPSASDGVVDRMEEQRQQQQLRRSWKHPAEPFFYEPVPGNAPAFILPHCA